MRFRSTGNAREKDTCYHPTAGGLGLTMGAALPSRYPARIPAMRPVGDTQLAVTPE